MAYKQLWGSISPGHIVYLIDLSGSMEENIDYTINVMHSVFKTLVGLCAKGKTVSERASFTIIGYNYKTYTIWDSLTVTEMAKKVLNLQRNGVLMFDKNKEFKPQYQTCMRLAFEEAKKDIDKWIARQTAAGVPIPAPIVINITDGYPYEGKEKTWEQVSQETLQAARTLMNISTPDGNVRLFNIHHGSQSKGITTIFPSQRPTNPAEQFLFDASSVMDDNTMKSAKTMFNVSPGARCMVSNEKDPSTLVKLIEFGSTQNSLKKEEDGGYF